MAYTANDLINQETGEIDWTAVKAVARSRAVREYGGFNPPPSWVRPELTWAKDRARIMRRRWRELHGLPDDTQYVTIQQFYQKPQFSLRSEW